MMQQHATATKACVMHMVSQQQTHSSGLDMVALCSYQQHMHANVDSSSIAMSQPRAAT